MPTDEATKIAVMQTEISYIKEQSDRIINKLDQFNTENTERTRMLQQEFDLRIKGVHERIEKKANKEDVEKINAILSRLNWIVISAVFVALLALIFK